MHHRMCYLGMKSYEGLKFFLVDDFKLTPLNKFLGSLHPFNQYVSHQYHLTLALGWNHSIQSM